jgi:hypothetical protein
MEAIAMPPAGGRHDEDVVESLVVVGLSLALRFHVFERSLRCLLGGLK